MFHLFKNNLDTVCQRFPKTTPGLDEDLRTQHTVVLTVKGTKQKQQREKIHGAELEGTRHQLPRDLSQWVTENSLSSSSNKLPELGLPCRGVYWGLVMWAPSHVQKFWASEGNQVFEIHHIVQLGCSEPVLSGKKGRNSSEIRVPRQGQGQAFQTHLPKESSSGLLCNSFLHVILYTCSVFKWRPLSLLYKQYLYLVRIISKIQTTKGRNFKINFDITI